MNETPLFFSEEQDRLFGVLHRPETDSNGKAFVFCHPFAEEKLWAHRVYVNFARELAHKGYAVLRFDYRGYGDSEGEFTHLTLAHHSDDIERAIALLHEKVDNIKETGLLGLRLGASLAWLAAARTDKINGPLVLWDPVLNGEEYVQEFLRSNLATQLAVYGEVRENREQLIEKLKRNELVNVDGYELSCDVYQGLSDMQLADCSEGRNGSTLVVQIGRTEKPKRQPAGFTKLIGADLRCVVEEPFWREIKRFYSRADNLFAATLGWLEAQG
ncbi:hypothetical protein MNBD_GAMMA15-644 [hydrothermal vent metagenome]|uniref:Serine aminopeptidase S33 domain-containing protein n=1 Tax=hydrothermal vent metagenome TaxID=652676 RepID=A0A3B0YA61_9ZZZZ